jgi:hypothetical protein
MKSHASVAKAVRLNKAAYPERYCIVPRCLEPTEVECEHGLVRSMCEQCEQEEQ